MRTGHSADTSVISVKKLSLLSLTCIGLSLKAGVAFPWQTDLVRETTAFSSPVQHTVSGYVELGSRCIFGVRAEPNVAPDGRRFMSRRSLDGCDMRLLVDGDNIGIPEIQAAILELQRLGHTVKTTVFAEPGRERNKNWNRFFSLPDVVFHAVLRNSSAQGEANDEAIVQECLAFERCHSKVSVSLLVSDNGYLESVREMCKRGSAVTVLIPATDMSIIRRYRLAGLHVIALKSQGDRFISVRAILQQHGSGQVELAEPCPVRDVVDDMELCTSFLRDLGYVEEEREFLSHAAAKFWRTNNLGALVVYPQQLTIEETCRIASVHKGRRWLRHSEKLAMVIPIASAGAASKKDVQKYGSGLAKQVFQGGGPFMLPDSEDIVRQALTKLAYLDGNMNADLAEAMLVFANAPHNQYQLRKNLNLLPAAEDSVQDVQEKLRQAFQSHLSSGRWRFAPKDTVVRHLLFKDGLLSSKRAKAGDVFLAMAKHAKLHGLPKMKTYNGYVFRILRALDSSPTSTGTVELAT